MAVQYITRVYNEVAEEKGINNKAIYVSLRDLTYRSALYEIARKLSVFAKKGYSTGEIYSKIVQYLTAVETRFLFVVDELDKMRTYYNDNAIDNVIYSLTRLNERTQKISVMNIFVTNNARIFETLTTPAFSSLAPVFVHFRNYNAEELYQILKDRVNIAFVPDVVDDAALKLLAAMILREGKDLRWALSVLREAATLADEKITENTIHEAVYIVERNVLEKVILNLDTDSIITLYALANLTDQEA